MLLQVELCNPIAYSAFSLIKEKLMGSCLSTPATSETVSFNNYQMRAAKKVTAEIGSMNSALTKETILLKECKNAAESLYESIRDEVSNPLDLLSLGMLTEKLDEAIDRMGPLKTTLFNLLDRVDSEYEEFEEPFRNYRRCDLPLDGLAMLHSSATMLNCEINAAIQAGRRLRSGAETVCQSMRAKYV